MGGGEWVAGAAGGVGSVGVGSEGVAAVRVRVGVTVVREGSREDAGTHRPRSTAQSLHWRQYLPFCSNLW